MYVKWHPLSKGGLGERGERAPRSQSWLSARLSCGIAQVRAGGLKSVWLAQDDLKPKWQQRDDAVQVLRYTQYHHPAVPASMSMISLAPLVLPILIVLVLLPPPSLPGGGVTNTGGSILFRLAFAHSGSCQLTACPDSEGIAGTGMIKLSCTVARCSTTVHADASMLIGILASALEKVAIQLNLE